MRGKMHLGLTLAISILIGIIFPLFVTKRPIDWDWFFYLMAIGFTSVGVIYAIVILINTFLGKGRLRIK